MSIRAGAALAPLNVPNPKQPRLSLIIAQRVVDLTLGPIGTVLGLDAI